MNLLRFCHSSGDPALCIEILAYRTAVFALCLCHC